MIRFISSIRESIRSQNWFSALFQALAVPDVCGALESPEAKVEQRYKSWFNRYLKSKYAPDTVFDLLKSTCPEALTGLSFEDTVRLRQEKPDASYTFTANDCYRFRCKSLHWRLAEQRGENKVHFTAPDLSSGNIFHKNSVNGVYQLSIDAFCLDVSEAVEQWLQDMQHNKDVQFRMRDSIEIHNPLN